MATVTRENIGLLHDKLTVNLNKEDYYNGFEQSLKKYAKTANIPGFRKGMVPAGLVKKMYGQSVFTDEVLRMVEKELNDYLGKEQLEIFAQPLPLNNDASGLDMNNPGEYAFSFEIGLKPSFEIDPAKINVTRYNVTVTDEMIQEEAERQQVRHGKMTEPEAVTGDDNVLNVTFTESDANGNAVEGGITKSNSLLVKYFTEDFRKTLIGKKNNDSFVLQPAKAFEEKEKEAILADLGLTAEEGDKYFNVLITKVGLVEKAELNEEFFGAAFPNSEIKTEADFRAELRKEIENYYAQQSRNQIHDQIYHHLVDHTHMDFPESFLKNWLKTGGEKPKTAEEAEAEYPNFVNQLKWTLISNQVVADNKIEVLPEDIREFAKQQLFSYMGGQLGALGDNQQWVEDYANRMMQDRKFVEDSYHRISTEKLFGQLENQVKAKEESISAADFASKLHHHHH
ncbi:trigger factor [Sediminibacterium ginsengisoli]|uniref:Trigger factor n=1 Tax=Sediminibacterium ginsengisoli TaxID=413434 RepID=A0A1T4K094_9BACT|nr:trigger factor [Sediminibacterium ginsengisoli]SJZ35794.1 trigger factor [Sediminibacterium ginsengisoli]